MTILTISYLEKSETSFGYLRDSNINISWLKFKVGLKQILRGVYDFPNNSSISDSDFPLVSGSRKYTRTTAKKLTLEYNLKGEMYTDHIIWIWNILKLGNCFLESQPSLNFIFPKKISEDKNDISFLYFWMWMRWRVWEFVLRKTHALCTVKLK